MRSNLPDGLSIKKINNGMEADDTRRLYRHPQKVSLEGRICVGQGKFMTRKVDMADYNFDVIEARAAAERLLREALEAAKLKKKVKTFSFLKQTPKYEPVKVGVSDKVDESVQDEDAMVVGGEAPVAAGVNGGKKDKKPLSE